MISKILTIIISATICFSLFTCSETQSEFAKAQQRLPLIFPDYTDLIIPSNIAPLNFIIKEDAKYYNVKFYGEDNQGFNITSRSPKIIIPIKKWKKLLHENINRNIFISISAKQDNGTRIKFQTIKNFITPNQIDSYLAFRQINPALVLWKDMSIVQRNIETFDESDILANKNTDQNCMNCHTFQKNNPDNMILHIREAHGGTLIKTNDRILWLNTKTPHTLASFTYPAWHPNGRYIAFSTNKIFQNFCASGQKINYVFDVASDIVIYDIVENKVFTSPKIASWELENLPNWSPDGKYLFYIKGPRLANKTDYKINYDLMRISFNEKTLEWGEPEMLISSEKVGKTISFPEVSPDGRFVLFCMADYGYFTIGNQTSDLYMLDLKSGEYKKLSVNSNQAESFHNWSSNGRWIVFASKRNDGIITLPYFSFIDSNGNAFKPFVLPARDPESIETGLFNFNRPVFIKGKVKISQNQLLKEIFSSTKAVFFDTINVDLDAIAGATISVNENKSDATYKHE
jgi:hypothetical protein